MHVYIKRCKKLEKARECITLQGNSRAIQKDKYTIRSFTTHKEISKKQNSSNDGKSINIEKYTCIYKKM